MKRKKSILAGLCTLVLTASIAIGGFAYVPAKADEATDITLDNVKVQSTVTYGNEFKVPAAPVNGSVTVKTPNGSTATVTNDAVTADQLGNYVVTYAKGDTTYSFRVLCELENELELFIENEARVPSVVKTGDAKKLPGAYVGYYNEDGDLVKENATVTVKTDKGEVITPGTDFTFANAGSTFVTYTAQVGGGKKFLTKTFEVKVQDNFADRKAPSLSVSGVPSSANVNKVVTLPTASASDSFDERVEVVITVKGKNDAGELVNVKKVTVDNETAVAELTEDEVFDNNKNMTFYPVREGDYKVTYKAIDDNGNESAEWTYTITCSDKKAPEITLDETKIPAKWGYDKVYKYDAAAENKKSEIENKAIKFAFPEVTDNKDKAADLTLTFAIKDPEGKTVVNFSNINKAAGESGTKYTNVVTGTEYKFSQTEEFSFDFGEYVTAIKNDSTKEDYQYAGDYVVTYTARDAAGNRSTKTYTINVAETFEDTSEVTVEFKTVDKYILADENKAVEVTLPAPTYSSTTDSKLTLVYTVTSGDNTLEADVKGGETAEIKKVGGDYKLVYDKKELVITGAELTFTATATSDTGVTYTATETVPVIVPNATQKYVDVTESLTLTDHKNDVKTHALGNVVINLVENADAKHVGVELGVKNAEGKYMTASAEIYAPQGSNKKVVRNITFETRTAGTYYLELRVFDINGNSTVRVIPVVIAETSSNPIEGQSSVNATSGDVNKKVILANEKIDMSGVANYVTGTGYTPVLSHKVTGGKFALMGEEFTAMTAGKYAIDDMAAIVKSATVTENYSADAGKEEELANYLAGLTQTGKYTVTDSATVKFELQGVMPSYSQINTAVNLPQATAYTENGNADEIVVDVKSPKSGKVTVVPATTAGYEYTFTPNENGTYTVTYTVKAGNDSSTFTYTIKVGDVVAPTFTLTDANGNAASHEATVKSGYKFSYLQVSATDNKSEAANLTYTKKVVGPDGKEVGSTISGKGTTYANRTAPTSGEFTLDASGKYTVTYTVTDDAGNESKQEFEITVTNSTSNSGISLATLSTILIIVGVLLIAGVLVYLFRFRRVKKN